MTTVIAAKQLVKKFGGFTAVDGISFEVARGECFGILGPNGAGKTSTIRMLYGFSPLSGGSLRILGHPLPEDLRTVKTRLGVCQQENTLDSDLTVHQNLVVFARFFGIAGPTAARRADELLRFIALDHRRQARMTELSGGMLRRLMLARALINDPEILILDEPTTGLDPQSRHQVWQRLDELKARGLSVLLTTHYMDEAAHLCDRLLILDHGRILVEGKPAELVRRHVGREVLELKDPLPELREEIGRRELDFEDLGHRMLVYGSDGDRLYHRLTAENSCRGCLLRQATLEDVFLRLTGRELRE